MPIDQELQAPVTEYIHGVPVSDPYRWLEDRKNPETERWLTTQRIRFEEYFERLGSRDFIAKRAAEYLKMESVGQIGKVSGRYFYSKRSGDAEQSSIFVADSSDEQGHLLVDSSKLDQEAAVAIHRISEDASFLAFEVKRGGEHTKELQIVDVERGDIIPDRLESGLARGFVFRSRRDGFYYCHEFVTEQRVPSLSHEVLFHDYGTDRDADRVLLTIPRTASSKLVLVYDGDWIGAIHNYLVDGVHLTDVYVSSQACDDTWSRVCTGRPSPFSPFFYKGRLFAHRFDDTPNGEIVELSPKDGTVVRVIVPEWVSRTRGCAIALDRLFVSYLVGQETQIRTYSLDGEYLGPMALESGFTWGLVPAFTNNADELFFHRESLTSPPSLFLYVPASGTLRLWHEAEAPTTNVCARTEDFVYVREDGVEIGLSLTGSISSEPWEDRPTVMTAYGGFGITLTPQFSPIVSILLELGCLFAVPGIRGGGEHGRAWHMAAQGMHRQVAFDDFIAAAEWLCGKGFASPRKLAIFGGSNSGLLVGAAVTQRPDLFGAVLCIAPLLDMVRYHLFDRAHVWANEYGTAEDADDFAALLAYSPYHHVKDDVDYPATMFVTGDKDMRCNPAHARKMAALLLGRNAQTKSILIDHTPERGHAPTLPLSTRVKALTHRVSFLCEELNISASTEIEHD